MANHGNIFTSFTPLWDAIWGYLSDKRIEDFTTYANTTEGDAIYPTGDTARLRVNPTTDVLDFSCASNSINTNIYRDIGIANISDTSWILRFKLDITTLVKEVGVNQMRLYISLNSLHALGDPQTEDGLGMLISYRSGNDLIHGYIDNGGTSAQTSTGIVPSATTYYVEFVRLDADNFRIRLFSDSTYTTQLSTNTITISSAYTGLRYFGVQHYTETGTTNNIVGTIDNILFANNRTTPPS